MTTVFGLKHSDVKTVILVADRQTTSVDNRTGIPAGKHLGRKLGASEDRNFCFGHSGLMDEQTEEFLQKLSSGGYDVERIVKKGYFPELRKLNIKRMGRKLPDSQRLSGIVLATRFDENPQLHTCFPLGDVEEKTGIALGSGYEKINEYMEALRVLSEAKDYFGNNSPMETSDLIRVGLEAVRRSQSQDLYSHGLDMIVCTSEGITDHFLDLGDDFGKKLKKLQRQYKLK